MVVATALVLALCALPSWNIPVLKEQRRDGVANRNSNKSSTSASKKQALAARESHALSSIEAFDAAVSRNTAILYGNITNSSPIRAASSPRLTMQLYPVIDSRGGPPKRIDKFVQSVDRNMAYYGLAHGMHKMPTHSYHRSGYRLASQKSSPIPVDSFVGHLNSNIRKAQVRQIDTQSEERRAKRKTQFSLSDYRAPLHPPGRRLECH